MEILKNFAIDKIKDNAILIGGSVALGALIGFGTTKVLSKKTKFKTKCQSNYSIKKWLSDK